MPDETEIAEIVDIPRVRLGKVHKRQLQRIAAEWFNEVNEEIKQQTGRTFFRSSQDDQYRLLVWRNWISIYKVNLNYIVKKIVPYWQKKFAQYSRNRQFGVGVKIATLTGPVSEQILRTQIERDFPDGENIQAWKSENQWARVRRNVKDINGEDFITRYQEVMEGRQARITRYLSSKRFIRRRYRNNPFL